MSGLRMTGPAGGVPACHPEDRPAGEEVSGASEWVRYESERVRYESERAVVDLEFAHIPWGSTNSRRWGRACSPQQHDQGPSTGSGAALPGRVNSRHLS